MTAAEQVIALAEQELGYCEKASDADLNEKRANAGNRNFTKYARDMDCLRDFYNGPKQGFAWCDVFYDWLFVQCFGAETARRMLHQPRRSHGAGCRYSALYYKLAFSYIRASGKPRPGDQVFFHTEDNDLHTGLVVGVTEDSIHTIEGNCDNQVARRTYTRSDPKIAGYGRPKWSATRAAEASVPEK